MSTERHPHEDLMRELEQEFTEVLNRSEQGIYIYLDDPHWICNNRMAEFLDYGSPDELTRQSGSEPLLEALVAPESRDTVLRAYTDAVERKAASMVPVTWKKKGGHPFRSRTIFAPISFHGNLLVMHFIVAA